MSSNTDSPNRVQALDLVHRSRKRGSCAVCNSGKPGDDALSVTEEPDGTVLFNCHRCGDAGAVRPERPAPRKPAAKFIKRERPASGSEAPLSAADIWNAGVVPGESFEHPYLTRKRVGAHGLRVNGDGELLVPMLRDEGEDVQLVGVQRIYPNGDKRYNSGARKTGAFHAIGEPTGCVVVCEGYATGASIHEATGEAVVIAFDCDNLIHVAKALRAEYPITGIVIAADDDYRTKGNPGITKATEAARAIGAKLAVPVWPDGIARDTGTDFNDLRNAAGDDAVRASIGNTTTPAKESNNFWNLPEPISESEFADAQLAPPCIVENYLFADVAVLVAPGGTGKTTLTLYEAIHIALGLPLFGLTIEKPGPVLIITAEDSRERLVARMRAIASALELTEDQRAQIRRDVRISDVSGEGMKLTLIAGDVVVPAPSVDAIIEQMAPLAPVLVSIDPAVSFGVGELRVNDAEQGLVDAARRIRRAGDCCVRYVHHSGKANARDKAVDQYAGRGGSALADGARMVSVLQPLDAQEWTKAAGTSLLEGETGMVLARPKVSYRPPQPDILICRKGYTFTSTTPATMTPAEELAANCDQIIRVIETECAAKRWPTKNTLEIMAPSLGRTRQEVRDAIAMLLVRGRIVSADVDPPPLNGARTYLRASPA